MALSFRLLCSLGYHTLVQAAQRNMSLLGIESHCLTVCHMYPTVCTTQVGGGGGAAE